MHLIEATVKDEVGLHARPANKFVRAASQFKSDIQIRRAGDEQAVNAKSIVSVLKLAAVKGTRVVITASGNDEETACEQLKNLLENASPA